MQMMMMMIIRNNNSLNIIATRIYLSFQGHETVSHANREVIHLLYHTSKNPPPHLKSCPIGRYLVSIEATLTCHVKTTLVATSWNDRCQEIKKKTGYTQEVNKGMSAVVALWISIVGVSKGFVDIMLLHCCCSVSEDSLGSEVSWARPGIGKARGMSCSSSSSSSPR